MNVFFSQLMLAVSDAVCIMTMSSVSQCLHDINCVHLRVTIWSFCFTWSCASMRRVLLCNHCMLVVLLTLGV